MSRPSVIWIYRDFNFIRKGSMVRVSSPLMYFQGRIQDLKLGVALMDWKVLTGGGGGGFWVFYKYN